MVTIFILDANRHAIPIGIGNSLTTYDENKNDFKRIAGRETREKVKH